ncbi:MAG: ABC transporter permease [Agathobacter sp.]|uniref:ABC transporter permease n=1 Tax=Agathobacter sp. TaxID=2021311 RepID=UPI002583C013|nr:ABC transporter permease [Agathobacter sp.]MCR5678177.1 ABC transporter permease [Agathobacter sp.]
MTKYLLKRLLHGVISIIFVVAIVMLLIYSLMDRDKIFSSDSAYSHQKNNAKIAYMYQKWEEYGYLDYVPYSDYMKSLMKRGDIDEATYKESIKLGKTAKQDKKIAKENAAEFKKYYESKGYTVERVDAITQRNRIADGGASLLFAYKNTPVTTRLFRYFTGIFKFDSVNTIKDIEGKRGLTFTWKDPAYGGDKFAPALMGNGTNHKYLIYVDNKFPFVHQNMLSLNLGLSYTVNQGVEITTTMTQSQGMTKSVMTTYPTGLQEESADDLHSAVYSAGSLVDNPINEARFTDNYTRVQLRRGGKSKLGYSFIIGIFDVIFAYLIGLPLGVLMARKKDKFIDKLGTVYIMFIIAIPSLAYIFLFKAIGGSLFHLPTQFDTKDEIWPMYILPIISLCLPAIAGLMKWMRRFMIDQMSADYVKFARSGGLSEKEIFSKHIMKNAAVPMCHDIPASVLGALTGAIITERVYGVPGVGDVLTQAIGKYDNGVIVGVTLFYAVLSVVALILGDTLMSVVDPRISFSTKDR